MNYILKMTQKGKVTYKKITITDETVIHFAAEPETSYQLFDEQGQPLDHVDRAMDLSFVIEKGKFVFSSTPNGVALAELETLAHSAVLASEVISTKVWLGLGALTVVGAGIGLAAAGKSGSKSPANFTPAKKAEAQKAEPAKTEAQKVEPEKAEAQKVEQPKAEAQKVEPAKSEAQKAEPAKTEAQKVEPQKAEAQKVDQPKAEAQEAEPPKAEAQKVEPVKSEAQKADPAKTETQKADPAKTEAQKVEPAKSEAQKAEQPKAEAQEAEPAKTEAQEIEPAKVEAQKAEPAKTEAQKTAQILLDNLTADNVINLAESQSKIRLTGKVLGEPLPASGEIALKIGEMVSTVAFHQGAFAVEIEGATFLSHQHITAWLVDSPNIKVQHDYQVDLTPPEFSVHLDKITGDNLIDAQEAQAPIEITGRTENVPTGTNVLITCGCPSCVAARGGELLSKMATVNDGKFSVWFQPAILIGEGRHQITATVELRDEAGNSAVQSAVQDYALNSENITAYLRWQPLVADNQINQRTVTQLPLSSTGKVRLSGEIVDLRAGEIAKVSVRINGEEQAVVIEDQHFIVEVPPAVLAQNLPIEAELSVRNALGQQQISPAERLNYRYDVEITAPILQIHPINDGAPLPAQAVDSPQIISGTLAHQSDILSEKTIVEVELNGKTYPASLNGNQWQAALPLDALQAQPNHTLIVKAHIWDQVGNQATGQQAADYQIAASDLPTETAAESENLHQILPAAEITSPAATIHFEPSSFEPTSGQFLRVSGKLALSGDFAVGKNASRVYEMIMQVGEKQYHSRVNRDKQTFAFAIPNADLPEVAGKAVSYQFKTAGFLYHLRENRSGYEIYTKATPAISAESIQYDSGSPIVGQRFVVPEKAPLVLSGSVSGATAGDKLRLNVGEQRFETTVDSQGRFRVEMPKIAMPNVDQKLPLVQATLLTGEQIIAQTALHFSQPENLSADFVSQHSHRDYKVDKMPYFLNALVVNAGQNPPPLFHTKTPFGADAQTVIRYHFARLGTSAMDFFGNNKEIMRKTLEIFSRYANIRFEETQDRSEADIIYSLNHLNKGELGMATYGGNVHIGVEAIRQSGTRHLDSPKGVQTILHETLHSLGLKHPHQESYRLPQIENRTSLTVMSYAHDSENKDLALYDLMFLHYRFGVNPQVRPEDNIYRFNNVDPKVVGHNLYIWDGGGIDTFDASDRLYGVNLNLTPGSWVYAGEKAKNFVYDHNNQISKSDYFAKADGKPIDKAITNEVNAYADDYLFTENQAFIGYGTQIERAIGSNYDDQITGNHAANALYGGAGNDVILGGAGNDYLDGGSGADRLSGNTGDDIYVVDNLGDEVIELANEGNDSVHSYLNYQLPDNVENLTLFGGATLATGNALANHIRGNDLDNTLNGGLGSDRLYGGKGRDRFVFSEWQAGEMDIIEDFSPLEDKIVLAKSLFPKLTSEDQLTHYVHYNKQSGQLYYKDGDQASYFAQLDVGLTLTTQHFEII